MPGGVLWVTIGWPEASVAPYQPLEGNVSGSEPWYVGGWRFEEADPQPPPWADLREWATLMQIHAYTSEKCAQAVRQSIGVPVRP